MVGYADRATLEDLVGGAAALVCLLTERIDEALFARAPALRIVANVAVGVDNIDLAAAARRGILVANTPDVLTEATADLAFALLLAAARRLGEAERLVRAGAWTGFSPTQLLGVDVWQKRLGLVGFGRIGRAIARRARGFDMTVLVHTPRPLADGEADRLGVTALPLAELCATSDFVVLACPLTPATRGMIGAAELALMAETAILVNTARGAVVDEDALVRALAAGRPGGAGLDVFSAEPAIHPGLLASPRVVLAPHIGSATLGARGRMSALAASAVAEVLAGRTPANLVAAAPQGAPTARGAPAP